MRITGILSTMLFLMVLGGCTTQPATVQSGPDAETIDGNLYKVDNSRVDESYVDPTVDFSRFDKIFIAQLDVSNVEVVELRQTSIRRINWDLSENDLAMLQQIYAVSMNEQIFEEGGYQQATETGENVLLLRIALKEIAPTAPFDTRENRGIGRQAYFTEGSGTLTIKGVLQDGGSGEIIGLFADEEDSDDFWGQNDRFNNLRDVKNIFNGWAKLFRAKLDKANGKSQG
jgi:hypothetical protein